MSLSRRTFLTTAGTVAQPSRRFARDATREVAVNHNTGGQAWNITTNRSQPSARGPADWFTGTVRIDRAVPGQRPGPCGRGQRHVRAGARTAWHTHPLGQTLIVTAGCGWVQREGGPVEEVHPGDVVWFPPGEKHWHGATPTTAMTHIAIQEQLDGKVVDWLEHVSDEQYRK